MMSSKHLNQLCDKLHMFREQNRYTDFCIRSGDDDILRCHQVVMAAASPFFDTMFGTEMRESSENVVDLPFPTEAICLILDFIYTGKNVINIDEPEFLPDLYHAAHYLQIASLVEECEKAFKKGVPESIALDVWHVAKLLGNPEVTEIAKTVVLQNFSSLCTVENIGGCKKEILMEVLSDLSLNCSGTKKCTAVWCWLVAQNQVDQSVVEQFMTALIKSENVDNDDILKASSTEMNEILDECDLEKISKLQAVWRSASQKLIWGTCTAASGRSYEWEDCVLVLGGNPREENKITVFNYKRRIWSKVNSASQELGHRYAICAVDGSLFVSGGTRLQKRTLCYTGATNQWTACRDMPSDREQHVMCAIGKDIYVLAGKSKTTDKLWDVCLYNVKTNSWRTCGQVAQPVTACTSALSGKYIYLIGGSISHDHIAPSDLVQYYNVNNNHSATISLSLPFSAKKLHMSAVSVGDSVYVVHKGDVFVLKKDVKAEKICSLQNGPKKGFGMAEFGQKIYVFGGEDARYKPFKHMIQYDTQTKQPVTLPICSPGPLNDFAVVNMKIPRSWNMSEV